MGVEGLDAVAAVVDNHTGKVRYQVSGFGAEADAKSFLRSCRQPRRGGDKVDFLSSVSIITGDEAKAAIKKGRV